MLKDKYICKEISYPNGKISRYFSLIEWSHLPYIDSLFFLEAYFKSNEHFNIERKDLLIYSFNNLQVIFHRILKRFLQGPLDKYYLNFIKSQLDRYCIFREVFLNNRYSTNPKTIFNCQDQFKLIIDLYQDLKELKKQLNSFSAEKSVVIPNKFDYQNFKNLGWQYSTIHFLEKVVKRKLFGLIDYFLIHGSFATKDFLEDWSDLDTLIILSPDVFQNSDNLSEFRKIINKLSFLCYKIEPLTHHRFFFVTNFDLNYYPICFFPPVLYDYSLLLSNNPRLQLCLREDNYRKIQIMSDFVNHFRNKILEENYSRNLIRWKEDLAQLMLWPSLLLQAKDIYLYKKYSFEKSKEVFPKLDFQIIDQASQIMEDWSRPNLLRYYPDFFFNFLPNRFNQIIVNQYRKYLINLPLKQTSEQVKAITQRALVFLEESFSLVLTDLNNEK